MPDRLGNSSIKIKVSVTLNEVLSARDIVGYYGAGDKRDIFAIIEERLVNQLVDEMQFLRKEAD